MHDQMHQPYIHKTIYMMMAIIFIWQPVFLFLEFYIPWFHIFNEPAYFQHKTIQIIYEICIKTIKVKLQTLIP